MRDAFSTYHPTINFLYFALVILMAMFFMHPVCLGISLFCALAYSIYLRGKKAVAFNLKYMLPLLILTAILNPAFNHRGITILTYLPSGNPLTAESIAYGLAAAVMLITVIGWFACYSTIMTSDKFVYLFGRVIPALSLILSMALRFIPRFRAQMKVVINAQRCVGRDLKQGKLLDRCKNGLKILSIMITWSLENAIETADSMKSRGYGLPGRTAFSIFRFDGRDLKALLFLLATGGYVIFGALTGGIEYRYFPSMQGIGLTPFSLSLFICYLALCLSPVIIDLWEDRKWQSLQSKI
ncbi:MAG: energy-coupling factor transporter transmembrane protein EcfT [Firmicutes bacterium]|nr:energy-coupling factor transporter transmembrane protein EcfT [Clostridiales bacterium]MBQ9931775.1 energy-coupling factor transporter transmembrane protein EcfT [Bacillota bacterium]